MSSQGDKRPEYEVSGERIERTQSRRNMAGMQIHYISDESMQRNTIRDRRRASAERGLVHTTEEPDALIVLVRVCGGATRQRVALPGG